MQYMNTMELYREKRKNIFLLCVMGLAMKPAMKEYILQDSIHLVTFIWGLYLLQGGLGAVGGRGGAWSPARGAETTMHTPDLHTVLCVS